MVLNDIGRLNEESGFNMGKSCFTCSYCFNNSHCVLFDELISSNGYCFMHNNKSGSKR